MRVINKTKIPDYKGFCNHIKEYDELGIPISFADLKKLAKEYNCEIPKLINGKIKFDTI
jgi:hypothetical protein